MMCWNYSRFSGECEDCDYLLSLLTSPQWDSVEGLEIEIKHPLIKISALDKPKRHVCFLQKRQKNSPSKHP